MIEFPSRPNRLRTSSTPRLFKIGAAVIGVLSLGNTNTSGQGLEESFFTPERIAEILPEIPEESVEESIKILQKDLKKNIAEKIFKNEFASFEEVEAYIITELEKAGITSKVLMQVQPLNMSSENSQMYEYLRICIVSFRGTIDFTLTTGDIDGAYNILKNMRSNFVEDAGQKSIAAFMNIVESNGGLFDQENIERIIHALLASKKHLWTTHGFEYESSDLQIVEGSGEILIHIQIIDTFTQQTIDKFISTGIGLQKDPPHHQSKTLFAQNTPETAE